jgi:hypothetical protein
LQLGKSMSLSRFDALVVTPPGEDRKANLLNALGEVAKVAVQSKAGVCNWTLENLPEMSYVLIYGTTVAANVKVDGNVLPKVSNPDPGSMPVGWAVDPTGNRLVIRLPSHHVEHSERVTEIEMNFS